jgi:predicted ATPase
MYIKTILIRTDQFPRKDLYPFNVKVFQETEQVPLRGNMSFFVGENGSGKSTLMEAVARRYGLAVWGGEKTHTAHQNPYETRLHHFIRVETLKTVGAISKGFLFRAENFFNYASGLDDVILTDPDILKYYGGQSFHQQSHGESFLSFFEHRCRMAGLYLLDEPESALSPANQLSFLKILRRIVQMGKSQFIISTHSPIILSFPDAQILSFDEAPIKEILYEETHSYQFYKDFLNNRGAYLEPED